MKIEYNFALPDHEPESATRVRSLGSYYTPGTVATAVANWAIRTGDEAILEPSAGAGALLLAAFERARQISYSTTCSATAYDIDPVAIGKLNELHIDELDVHLGDFLEQTPELNKKFDLVLANPPFNRNHSIAPSRRGELRARFGTAGAMGLWGHFLLQSLHFLREGGRVASIVPRSVLFTVHGDAFLKRLCGQFDSVQVCELNSKPAWSNFADEAGAVIFADGFKSGCCDAYSRGMLNDDGSICTATLPACEIYSRLSDSCTELGLIAQISIGAVTGRNKIFLLTEDERVNAGLSREDVRPVVSRARQLTGLTLTLEEVVRLAREGQKMWLLAPSELNEAVSRYLEIIPIADRETVVWFRKRNPWWKVQIASNYDAVFTYMNDFGPRIISLAPGLTCTNTLHRISFRADTTDQQRISSALTAVSTFGQLAGERIGRHYGGGVLKFELAEARRFPVIDELNFTSGLLAHVDKLLKVGKTTEATLAVDEAFMPKIFGQSWQLAQSKMQLDLMQLRNLRRGVKGANT
jgi:adenine-specific DNA-methyltransferase